MTLRFTVDAPIDAPTQVEAEEDPWASPANDSHQVSQMTDRDATSTGHPGDRLSEVSTGQNGVSTGQIEVSTGQRGDRPLFNPSSNPSQIPHVSLPSADQTAVANNGGSPSVRADETAVDNSTTEPHANRGPGSMGIGIENEKNKIKTPRRAALQKLRRHQDPPQRLESPTPQ